MNQFKAFLATIGFVLVMALAVQNVDVLSRPMTIGLDWPQAVAFSLTAPLYALLSLIFFIGFALVSLFSLREHLARRKMLRAARADVLALERKLAPPPQIEPVSMEASASRAAQGRDHDNHLQTETEQPMDSSTSPPVADQTSQTRIMEEEIIARPSRPGWGAVILLTAALALVFSGGVYVVLNEQMREFAGRFDHVSELTGHLHSAQEEMQRSWEQDRGLMREELQKLEGGQADLGQKMDALHEQIQALNRLPEEVRKRLVAGFLRDTAGRAAFLGTQVESDKQREALKSIHERLQTLAGELESAAAPDSGEE